MKTVLAVITLLFSLSAFAGPREQANTLFNRLNGVPPSSQTLDKMTKLIKNDKLKEAALVAIDHEDGKFYNITLKEMVAPWTNEDRKTRVDLNDFTATVIGMVRDEVPFNKVLSGDIVYVGASTAEKSLPEYSLEDNRHYSTPGANQNDEIKGIQQWDLPLHETLVKKKQSNMTYLTEDAAAGVLTTYGFAKDYYNAGTNRAAIRFTLLTFLCRDIEEFSDTTRADYRVRQDVSRAPGGDSSTYKNKCAGCHAGMDGHAGAFAYINYDPDDQDDNGRVGLDYDPSRIAEKYFRNADTYPGGHETKDDSWINLWSEGQNESIGWRGKKKGSGPKSWGRMITSTKAFSQCMAERAITSICHADTDDTQVQLAIQQLANKFEANDRYNMKHLFANAALLCRGD